MARYMERAENVARIIEVNSHMTLDMPGEEKGQWRPLITITGDVAQFDARYSEANQENVIRFLAFDRENPNSIISCLSAARENARVVRSSITTEMWEQINKMYLFVNQAAISPNVLESPYIFYTRVKMSALLYQGITEATMTHGEAWHFCRLARSMERADKTSRLLDVKYFILLPTVDYVGLSMDDIQWAAVLRSASAFEMYRRQHGVILPDQVAEFLLLDRDFPRAVLHCLYRAEESLRWIAGAREGAEQTLPERRLGQLRSDLTYMRIEEIIGGGLHEFLDRFQLRLNMVGTAIYDTFFALHPAS
jgi:uncharacterized alpha-E superfamily protein